MKKITKIITASAVTVGAVTTMGLGMVHAASTTTGTSLIDRLVQRFNLKKSDVQQVFDQYKTDQQANRQQKLEDRLTQAVKDGKLTEDQKTKILAKLKEVEANRQANRTAMEGKTAAERQAAIAQERADLEKWASDNNIPLEYLRPGFGGGMHRGMMGGGMMAPDSTATN